MLIKVKRVTSDSESTLSTVDVDGEFVCFGLEDEHRAVKVAGETRIPANIYPVTVRTHGGFHERYFYKFAWHKGMLEVAGVPDFTDILIHIGNTESDTAGCLLVGMNANTGRTISIGNSTSAYTILYNKVIDSALRGELFIEYEDIDQCGKL